MRGSQHRTIQITRRSRSVAKNQSNTVKQAIEIAKTTRQDLAATANVEAGTIRSTGRSSSTMVHLAFFRLPLALIFRFSVVLAVLSAFRNVVEDGVQMMCQAAKNM